MKNITNLSSAEFVQRVVKCKTMVYRKLIYMYFKRCNSFIIPTGLSKNHHQNTPI